MGPVCQQMNLNESHYLVAEYNFQILRFAVRAIVQNPGCIQIPQDFPFLPPKVGLFYIGLGTRNLQSEYPLLSKFSCLTIFCSFQSIYRLNYVFLLELLLKFCSLCPVLYTLQPSCTESVKPKRWVLGLFHSGS